MTDPEYHLFVGIDWASTTHQVAVITADRHVVHEASVAHDGAALQALGDRLLALSGATARVAVALEVPHGAVVDGLLARGFAVFAINPKQLDRFRDRYSAAGAKDDRRDALVLATALATDPPAFRRLRPEDPALIRLRELSRVEQELRDEAIRLANRLREQLQRFYAQLLVVCPAANEPWLWALLELAPTPAHAQRLTRPAVSRLLREHRIRRLTADALLPTLHATPLPVAPGTTEAAAEHIALLLPRLRLIAAQRDDCARRIERALETLEGQQEHRDVAILRSLPGVGRIVAATMLAEASRLLAARDYHGLRAQTGVAPVTRQSGKRRLVAMRYSCNPRLRNAVHYWGQISVQRDPRSQAHYARLRADGHSHARAIRGVIDRLLHVLVAMLASQTRYDPDRRPVVDAA